MDKKLTWFRLFNTAEVTSLPYVEQDFDLQDYGPVTARLTKGQHYALVLPEEELFLPVGVNGRNPFITPDGKFGAALDAEGYVWLGVLL